MNLERKTIDKVSFITTVYNEEKSVIPFLESLFSQEVLPEEVVIVDGGSNDSTLRLILNFLADEIKRAVDFLSEDRILSFSIFVKKDFEKHFEKQNVSPGNLFELKNKLEELENLNKKYCTRPIDSEHGGNLKCNINDTNLIFSAKLEFVTFDR
ncbi:MAG: glycosyltransferase, partial [Actinobacteria bacterium]|nr:glycosyltransferase [Actinomycetota bacterium]